MSTRHNWCWHSAAALGRSSCRLTVPWLVTARILQCVVASWLMSLDMPECGTADGQDTCLTQILNLSICAQCDVGTMQPAGPSPWCSDYTRGFAKVVARLCDPWPRLSFETHCRCRILRPPYFGLRIHRLDAVEQKRDEEESVTRWRCIAVILQYGCALNPCHVFWNYVPCGYWLVRRLSPAATDGHPSQSRIISLLVSRLLSSRNSARLAEF